jgi:hypothetical protein
MTITRTARVIALLIVLVLAPQVAARAQDAWAAAKAQADAFEASAAGKPFVEAVGKAFEREHSATFSVCAKEVRRPDLSDFTLLLKVVGDGLVSEALAQPGTNLASCICGKLQGWKVSPPPGADAWVKIEVHLKPK